MKKNVIMVMVEQMRVAYYGRITHIDHQIRRSTKVLEEHNELNIIEYIFNEDILEVASVFEVISFFYV